MGSFSSDNQSNVKREDTHFYRSKFSKVIIEEDENEENEDGNEDLFKEL